MSRNEALEAVDGFFLRIGQRFRHKMAGETLTMAQFFVLRKLFSQGPMTMGALADALGVSFAATTGIVDRLVQARLVQRRRSEMDRRVVWVELSSEGQEKMAAMRDERRKHLEELLKPLDDQELEELARLLQRVAEGVESRA